MKWFQGITALKELRKKYRRLAVKHHPDNGGSENDIKEINAEYDILFKKMKNDFEQKDTYKNATDKQKQSYDWQKDAQIRETLMQLSRFRDITVEVIGVWIWVSDCCPYRKELKALGFRWARQKQMWYKHFDDYHRFSSRPASMNYIRNKYGSVEIRFNAEKEEMENCRRIKSL
ncbi:chaperone protein DnaJ [Lachnospiraceae bacterium]|nr:chaperone protein DnaJ [Lachnospiraceae bacterium]